MHPYIHYITLHYITLHYITLHYITLHYITLHYITYIIIHTISHIYIWVSSSRIGQVHLGCRRGYRPVAGHAFGRCGESGWCSAPGGTDGSCFAVPKDATRSKGHRY